MYILLIYTFRYKGGGRRVGKRHHYKFVTVLTAIETKVLRVWQVTKKGVYHLGYIAKVLMYIIYSSINNKKVLFKLDHSAAICA